jgi:hypothetical protein
MRCDLVADRSPGLIIRGKRGGEVVCLSKRIAQRKRVAPALEIPLP